LNQREYRAYLRSPEWRARRRRALALAGDACEVCGKGGRLEVHHTTYARLGKERLSDLVVLCRRCHRWVHNSGRGAWSRRRLLKKA